MTIVAPLPLSTKVADELTVEPSQIDPEPLLDLLLFATRPMFVLPQVHHGQHRT